MSQTLSEQTIALVRDAGSELEAHFAAMLADPRVTAVPGAVSPTTLNNQLSALTDIVIEKGQRA